MKAAVVLLPLLGVSNIISMVDDPLGRSVAEFAVWSYVTHFLTSFQGFFVSLLYCFLNGEVRRCDVSIALHHLPFDEIVTDIGTGPQPGGRKSIDE